jgi:hypothetical protein
LSGAGGEVGVEFAAGDLGKEEMGVGLDFERESFLLEVVLEEEVVDLLLGKIAIVGDAIPFGAEMAAAGDEFGLGLGAVGLVEVGLGLL